MTGGGETFADCRRRGERYVVFAGAPPAQHGDAHQVVPLAPLALVGPLAPVEPV
jgi:hypothetical protein